MTDFETQIQGLDESEDGYMLVLMKLFKACNLKAKSEDLQRAVKRKLLYGMSETLRHNLFIFCNNPLDDTVTHQDLLKSSYDAFVHHA